MLYKILFTIMLMMGSLISISSSTWMGMWLGLEVNLLSIIPLMNNSMNIYSSEASLKYFITQALASTIIMFSIILIFKNLEYNNYKMIILNSALLLKMGASPFHFWFPEIMEGLNWMNCLIMLTWQKIAPMIILMYNLINYTFMMIIIILSMLIGGIMGMNQTSMRKILTYSSINHMGWMISSMMFYTSIWTFYYLIYSMISSILIFTFYKMNIFHLKQLILKIKNNFNLKLMLILNFFSMGGLPPFLGFMPKWLTIQNLINNKLLMLSMLMILITMITLFFYTRIMFKFMVFNSSQINFSKNYNFNLNFVIMLNSMSIFGLILINISFNLM